MGDLLTAIARGEGRQASYSQMFNANNSSMDDTWSTFVPYQDSSKEMNNTVKSIMIIFFFFQRIIQEYFQPKIGRKIRKFNLGRKNNILIKKESVLASKAPHKANWNTGFVTFQPAREGWNKIYIFYQVFQRWPKVEIWPSALLRNVQNIRNCMGEKTIVSVAHECKRLK